MVPAAHPPADPAFPVPHSEGLKEDEILCLEFKAEGEGGKLLSTNAEQAETADGTWNLSVLGMWDQNLEENWC